MNKLRIFCYLLTALLGSQMYGQNLTVSAYSRYALGDILDNTTTRNAGMGGIGIATDNYFSINRVNPASYADIIFTTMDISVFGQPSQIQTNAGETRPVTAGFQNLSFAFPANKGPVLAFGFAPYSTTGYDVFDTRTIELDTTYIQNVNYTGEGGLNQLFFGGAFRLLKKRLRVGANLNYVFGNTLYNWDYALFEDDSTFVPGVLPTSITRDAYVRGLQGQTGIIYVDTLNVEKRRFIRLGATADFGLRIVGDRFTTSNGDTVSIEDLTNIQLPSKYGFGFMVHELGSWSIGGDFTYQDWSQFQYFSDSTNLGPEIRLGLGGEWIPNIESFKYVQRIAYRLGAYVKQTYITFGEEPVSDIGFSFGLGLPTGRTGNNRFNRGRASSRVNLSFELGRRGSLAGGLPVQENYARIRLGINLNERWFVRRVVD